MKKLILLAIVFSVSLVSYSQFTVNNTPYYDYNAIKTNMSIFTLYGGRVGMQYTHDSQNQNTRGLVGSNIFWDHTNNLWKNTSTSTYRDFAMMRFQNGSEIAFFVSSPSSPTSTPVEMTNSEMEANRIMILKNTKKVGIGTNNPDEKLTVNGTIHCKEVKVDLNVPADYVFEKYYNGTSTLKADYTMPTLEEVAIYTKENNHLPEMPSAQEIKKNGLHLKEMTNLLLQKIEELTLYAIEQEKRINALEAKLVTTTDEVETK